MTELGDFVSLKEFEGGLGWYARVHTDGLRYMKIFEKLSGEKLEKVARAVGGEIVDKKFYDNVAWTVQVRPLPYLQILMVLTLDPEFGNDFFTYYSRSALGEAPTEDIIVYSWIYMALLASEAQEALYGQELKSRKMEMTETLLEERLRVFKHIDASTARKLAGMIGGISVNVGGAAWAIEKEPVPNFRITYLLKGEKGEILYSKDMVEKFHYFHDFLWLYCNAIIRESRKLLGDKIPMLSASGIL